MTDTLWLLRHGNREDFVDDSWRETAERPHDPDLSPDGRDQVRHAAEALRGEGIAVIFASPFLRTVRTAALVAEELDVPVRLEWGFAEWMNAHWFDAPPQTLPAQTLAEQFGCIDTRYESRFDLPFPEEKADAYQRAARTARALADATEGPLLLVGHGITATGAAEGLSGRTHAFGDYPLCGLAKLRRGDDGWSVDGDIRTDHLPGGAGGGGRLN